jgi:hypothetical protein
MHRFGPAALASASILLTACFEDDPMRPLVEPAASVLSSAPSDPTPSTISLTKVGEFQGGGVGAAEVTAFDPVSKRLFVVNGILGTVDVLDLKRPSSPTKIGTMSVAALGASANGVAAHGGVVAVAVEGSPKTQPGTVAFYRATTLELISSVTVGALPDMVIFTPSGQRVLVANEGEPDASYTDDPEGSISIIDVTNINTPTVRTAGFSHLNGQADALRAQGVRLFGPGASVAQDLEPEYIALSDDGRTAYATLQENNAVAIVDVEGAFVTRVVPLGFKDHSLPGNGIDASDRDNAVNIRNWPVFGMYMPDAIASYASGGRTYLVTANEGDAREYLGSPGFVEEARVNTLTLEPTIFTDALCGGPCAANARLGRLTVTRTLGLNAATGRYDALYAFGARSISIWDDAGRLVWDSGDDLEQRTAALPMVNFNASNNNNALEDRSDNKGPEPEGVALGRLGTKTFAFVGLERVGGIMVYDVTEPSSPAFVSYANTRMGAGGDLGPEGVAFVPAVQSPSKRPLLIVGNEVSGTTAIFEIRLH